MYSDFDLFVYNTSNANGLQVAHAGLTNPITTAGTYCRGWDYNEAISSVKNKVVAYIKPTVQGGRFFAVPSTSTISIKSWIRHERVTTSATNFTDSARIGFGCKMPTEPDVGNPTQSIGGYTLEMISYHRFGADRNNFVLKATTSGDPIYAQNTYGWQGAESTLDGFGSPIVAQKWYRLRLDVSNIDANHDQLAAYHFTGTDEDNPLDWTYLMGFVANNTGIPGYSGFLPWGNPAGGNIGFFAHFETQILDNLDRSFDPKFDMFSVSVTDPGDAPAITVDGLGVFSGTKLFAQGADAVTAPTINKELRVSNVVDSTHFEVESENVRKFGTYTDVEIYPVASAEKTYSGPYVLDPNGGVSVSENVTTMTHSLAQGRQYSSIIVADATVFPDEEGFLVFGFGYEHQVGPVRYLGRYSDTELALDYNFEFTHDVPSDATVTLLTQKGPFGNGDNTGISTFNLTASNAGQIEAVKTLGEIISEGSNSTITVVYPGDRGLGNEGQPVTGSKIADTVRIWGSDDVDSDIASKE